jgi:hypothetical protein
MFPVALALSVGLHVLVGRGIKAVLWAASPLATGEVEAFAYERSVYSVADWAMAQVVGLVLLAGLLFWAGLTLSPPWSTGLKALASLVWLGALALDLLRWHRVSVAASAVRWQRGVRGRVHMLKMDTIESVDVREAAGRAPTWRQGRQGRLVGLVVHLSDQRVVSCPRTDALTGRATVDAVADFVQMRLAQRRAPSTPPAVGVPTWTPRYAPAAPASPYASAPTVAPSPSPHASPAAHPAPPPSADAELRRALKRLRRRPPSGKSDVRP